LKEKKAFPVPWLMVSLSMLIIGAGIAGGFLIQSLLPSYKNTIITVTDVPEIKQMLYVEDTEELVIFPWDQYNPKAYLSLEEYFKQVYFLSSKENSSSLSSDSSLTEKEKILFEDFKKEINEEIYVRSRIDSLDQELDFSQALKIDRNSNRFYLKDFSYVSSTKTPYVLDLVWDRNGKNVYLHTARQSEELMLPSTLESAYETLDEMFESANKFLNYGELDTSHNSNPLLHWYWEVFDNGYWGFWREDLLYWLADKKHCERIVYRDEILLVYDLEGSKRIVLFYDPFLQHMNGYSLNV
jgi:hypothetical protein